jgi:transglutaminase-like putative cysteine protease
LNPNQAAIETADEMTNPNSVPASRRVVLPALAGMLLALPLAAQAPKITPKGDPSVKPDTIYRLAVDPKDAPDEAAIYLLDDGVLRFESDGRSSRTFRQIVQILTPAAAEQYREQQFSWSPGHEKFTLNWIRVVKPDGTVISAGPAHEQDSDVPASLADPVYADRRVHRASLSGVEPGTIVDFSYTTEELKPFLLGDLFEGWNVSARQRARRSRLIVDAPTSLKLRIKERNLDFERRTTTAGGRTTYTWATQEVPLVRAEPFAADSNNVVMGVRIGSPLTWQDIAKWYADNARDRYQLTPEAEKALHDKVAGARTLADSIRAAHRWVAQDIRYVSIALGLGGYQPRAPGTVVQTGFGDCKDKATLFVASLKRMGVEAYPVLLSSSGGVDRGFPTLKQFDHAIAAVRLPGAGRGYQYVDLTSELTPYGELPPAEQGEFGLVVHPDGSGEEITFPLDSIGANTDRQTLIGTLSPDGTFTGRLERKSTGTVQYTLRSTFDEPLDSAKLVALGRSVARSYFPVADADSVEGFNGKDLGAPARLRMRILGARAAQMSGEGLILTLPFASTEALETAAQSLEEGARNRPRRFPIDASEITGADVQVQEFRVTLPEGWRARLPEGVSVDTPFGSYFSEYVQQGRELRFTRRVSGKRGIYPPDRIGDLVEFFRAMGRDNAHFIILEPATRS